MTRLVSLLAMPARRTILVRAPASTVRLAPAIVHLGIAITPTETTTTTKANATITWRE